MKDGYEMSVWQPIETAPKDDFVRILAAGQRRDYFVVQIIFWAFTYGFKEVPMGDDVFRRMRVRLDEGWRREGTSGEIEIDFEPSHWMPLPKPPPL